MLKCKCVQSMAVGLLAGWIGCQQAPPSQLNTVQRSTLTTPDVIRQPIEVQSTRSSPSYPSWLRVTVPVRSSLPSAPNAPAPATRCLNRTAVNPAQYRGVGYLARCRETERQGVARQPDCTIHCTGSLIAPNLVITASHCVEVESSESHGRESPPQYLFVLQHDQVIQLYRISTPVLLSVRGRSVDVAVAGIPGIAEVVPFRTISDVPIHTSQVRSLRSITGSWPTICETGGEAQRSRFQLSEARFSRISEFAGVFQAEGTTVVPGDSGSPVLLDGKLVGIVTRSGDSELGAWTGPIIQPLANTDWAKAMQTVQARLNPIHCAEFTRPLRTQIASQRWRLRSAVEASAIALQDPNISLSSRSLLVRNVDEIRILAANVIQPLVTAVAARPECVVESHSIADSYGCLWNLQHPSNMPLVRVLQVWATAPLADARVLDSCNISVRIPSRGSPAVVPQAPPAQPVETVPEDSIVAPVDALGANATQADSVAADSAGTAETSEVGSLEDN